MTVYVFGNENIVEDSTAIKIAKKIKGVNFKFIKPNEDVEFDSGKPVILDVVKNLKKMAVFNNIDDVEINRSSTVHDFDLGFQLKYLKKLGKLQKVTIIGLPERGTNYLRVQSILRKLVAQDIQGS